MPTFLHTADWHINALRRLPGYLDRMESTLHQITDTAKKYSVDFVVVAGDVYQTRSISHEERRLFSSWLGSLPVPAVIISGNHDKRLEVGDTSLNYLSSLSSSLALQHVVHDGLPFIQEVAGTQLVLMPHQGWTHQEMVLLADILIPAARRRSSTQPIVVVMHEQVRGIKMDSGFEPTASRTMIRLKYHPEVAYWALGDIHKMQSVLPNAWYCGAPHQVNFGEVLPKGVLVVSTKKPTEPKFVPLRSRPLLSLTELPEKVPTDAYIQLRPTKPLGRVPLPFNVTLHPSAHLLNVPASRAGTIIGTFDLLDDYLESAQLTPDLRPAAWAIVKEVGDQLGVAVSRPKKEASK